MNIDNNLGMALFLNGNANSVPASGGLQGVADGTPGGPGSLFQQLISRMLAAQNLAAAGENSGDGVQDKSGGTGGDLLSQLLLAEGNLTGISLLNEAAGTDSLTAAKGQAGESSETDENGQAMEMLQALMGGLINAAPGIGSAAGPWELTGKSAAGGIASADSSVKAAAIDPNRMSNWISAADKTVQNSLEAFTALNDGRAARENGKPVPSMQNMIMQAGEAAQENGTVLTGAETPASTRTGLLESVEIGQADGAAAKQETASGQEFKLSGIESGMRTATAESRTQGEISGAGLTQNLATDSANSDKTELQSPMQNAEGTGITGGEAAALNPLQQPAGTADPYSQIGDKILARFESPAELRAQLEQKGPMEFKMQLEPEDLGQIDIKLKLSEGKLMIDILAANSKTQALLASQVDRLVSSMGLQNVHVESVQVSQQMNSQSQDGGQNQYTANSAMDFSQRRQQEQYQQEIFSGNKPAAFSLQQGETQDINPVSRIEAFRYDSHRMNYTV